MDKRYFELKKENDQVVMYLTDSYKNLAEVLVKKARGYANKSIDTEVKIKNILLELRNFDESRINFNVAIPVMNDYIEAKMRNFAKRNDQSERIKGIVATTIFLVVLVAWIGFGLYMGRSNKLDAPKNLKVDLVGNELIVSWDHVDMATNYEIYYTDSTGNTSATRTIKDNRYSFDYKTGVSYTFYIKALGSQIISSSDVISIKYPN